MFKNKKSRTILIAVSAILVLSASAFSKTVSETAEIFYNNIKIYIDGAEIVPKDANGNITEAFIMNGTTYLPVRAVANAFGKEVEWDGQTQSVYIGKKDHTKPDNYLDRIQYNDYKESGEQSDFAIINGTVTDYNNNSYTNGILFNNYATWSSVPEDVDEANILISYPLNSQYKELTGKIVLPKSYNISTWGKEDAQTNAADIWFYGDNKLIHKVTNVTSSMPFSIDLDITGVNQLTIKIKGQNGSRHIALTDLALYK